MSDKNRKKLIRIIVSAVVYFPLLALHLTKQLHVGEPWELLLFIVPWAVAGWDVVAKAVRNILHGQVFDENFLMLIATVGAFVVGEYSEAVAVMLFYQVGELFEGIAVGRTRSAVAQMMDIAPEYANVETEDGLEKMDPDEVEIGSIIVVRPGEKIPLDGIITEGSSQLDTSALTGESMPRAVSEGDTALSGCINGNGTLHIKTTRDYDDSTVARILELVENASSQKAKVENFITRFARYYTPAVTLAALLLALLGPLVFGGGLSTWVFRACIFLVVSCPCALVISVPLGFFCGIGAASRLGVLVKGSNYLEILADTEIMVFDKTGTLTEGRFKVSQINTVSDDESESDSERLLHTAAHAESYSTHPLAASLLQAFRDRGGVIEEARLSEVEEIPGRGVSAVLDGRQVLVGSRRLMEERGVEGIGSNSGSESGGSVVCVAMDGKYLGHILIADSVRENAADTISLIKKNGVRRIVMLTGDDAGTAAQVAERLGVDEHHGNLLPEGKVKKVEELLGSLDGKRYLAFVGDGINDTPVLTRSDVGIAMGGIGSDAAIEAADIVLMQDDLGRLPDAIRIARSTVKIVRQNIVFSLAVKLLVLLLGAAGFVNMWAAVFADVGTAVIAITNSMRLLRGTGRK